MPVHSLNAHSRAISFEIVVVDGASYDGCGEMLAREFPSVCFVQSSENVGFARANNLGVRHAKGGSFLFLNPDTELIEDTCRILFEQLQSLPGAGAVGCRLLNGDRTLQTSCVQSFPTVLNQALDSDYLRRTVSPLPPLGHDRALFEPGADPVPVEVISGACLMVKRECFERVGGFTESYFMYGEDLDLCFKIHRSGAGIYYVPQTSLIHFGSGSTARAASDFSTFMMRESVFRFMRFNRGLLFAEAYRVSTLLMAFLRLLLIGPLLLFGDRIVRHGLGSWRKTFAIVCWSLGLGPTT